MTNLLRVPPHHEMMPEIYQALQALGGSGTIKEIDEKTIELLHLPQEILDIAHVNSNKSEIEYRLAWARTYMKKVGILENSTRGVWALTMQGREMSSIDPDAIVKQVYAQRQSQASNIEDDDLENDGVEVPDEIQSWRSKLKTVLQSMNPDAFERLTQRLLRESGFTQVKVTGKSGDGGIDGTGIVKLNGILSFHMLFQCKRYKDIVSSSEIRDFRGAMQGRADKGLFITTGRFSAAAIEEANRPGTSPIDLVDGEELIEKLRELQLGIIPVNDYIIDESWFMSL